MRVRAGGARLYGADTGTGPPVVLLHGLASTHRWWDLVVPRLRGYRVIRFDHRGHGRSTAPAAGYDLAGLAADTLAVLDALGLERVVLAGHSLGAAVALRVAATHPHRVAGLACVEGGLYDPVLMFGDTWEQARPVMTRPRRGRVTEAVLRAWLAGTDLPAEALPAVLANYAPAGPDGALRLRLAPEYEQELARDLWRQDPVPLLAAVTAPVLAVVADQGDSRLDGPRRCSLDRAAGLPGIELSVRRMSGGHELPLARPVPVARALAELAALVSAGTRVKISATWR